MSELLLPIFEDALWSALAAMGFAILFNVPRKTLLLCMLGGAIGHAFRFVLIEHVHFSVELSTLLAASLIGFGAKWCAYRYRIPSMIFAIAAVIPMVPGVFAYRTMIGIFQAAGAAPELAGEILMQAALNAIRTGLILAALAVGIVSPTLLFLRQKPVV